MEPQRFYEFDNSKLYNVHFANWQGLTNDQITQIFAQFGQVVGVREAGDAFGFRFVRYRQEDEVVRCVEGLRDHPTIRLKVKKTNFNKKPDQDKQSGVPCGQQNFERNGHRSAINNRQSFENPADKSIKSPEKNQRLNNNISTVASTNNSSQQRNDVQSAKAEKQVVQATKLEHPKVATPLRQPEVAAKSFMPAYVETPNEKKSAIDSITSPAIAAPPSGQPEAMPRLVAKIPSHAAVETNGAPKSPQATPPLDTRTLTAEEVVFANIHSDLSIHYILHLIQKHNPLSISGMKIVPSGLRYCIVYLQSLQQAYAVEKEFDHFKLSGKDLIVMRSNRLMELMGGA